MNRNRIRRVIKIKYDQFLFFFRELGGLERDFSDFEIFFFWSRRFRLQWTIVGLLIVVLKFLLLRTLLAVDTVVSIFLFDLLSKLFLSANHRISLIANRFGDILVTPRWKKRGRFIWRGFRPRNTLSLIFGVTFLKRLKGKGNSNIANERALPKFVFKLEPIIRWLYRLSKLDKASNWVLSANEMNS